MSFGFSISDLVATIELASRIRKEFINAPNQFKAISDEVRSLSIVLQDVEVILPEQGLTSQQKADLQGIAERCHNVLEELEKLLDKYRELSSCPESVGKRILKAWKRLKWEPEDIQELRNRISSNITLLIAFDNRLIRNGVVKLVQHHDDQEHRDIMNWLSPVDYATQQNDFISRRHKGTGQWLLNSDEFQVWLNQSNQTLFCLGIPGAGKTIITSIVINYLRTKFRNDANIGIAYLYCNYRQQQQQQPKDLISNLLKQLAQEKVPMLADIKILYKTHRTKRTPPSFNEVIENLHSITQLYSKVFIIIDALDECHVSNKGCDRLLSEVYSLRAKAQVNLFVTSRFVPEIISHFEGCMSKEIRANNDDILMYVNERIPRLLRSRISKYPDLQDAIRREVVKAADGMFLLAQLHIDSLLSKPTPGDIRLALQNLPRGIKGLDAMYEQAMKRINDQEKDFRELANQVLSWVIQAKRPLTTLELQHALAVRDSAVELDKDFVPEIEDLVSICAGLITINEHSNIIRWVHYTTQEYFERTWTLWVPNAQVAVASVCLNYLSFKTFENGFCPTDEEFEARLQLNPLYDYAARNWGYHVRIAETEVEHLILNLLESKTKVSSSSQAMEATRGFYGYSQRVPRRVTGVHLAAYFGLTRAMMALLKERHDLDVKDTYHRTPLLWATIQGHELTVKLLLENDAQLESKDDIDRTPLSWAAENGHLEVAKLLLEKGAQLESKDGFRRTPLSWAAENKNEAVVKLLLEEGAQLESEDNKGRTPLSWAAENGNEMIVKLLIENGAQLESKNSKGRTSLSWAAGNGHETVVRLLLEKGAQLESKNNYNQTPLLWAAENGHEAVVKLLLEKGAQLESENNKGRTPLSWAAENGHEAVVKLLLGNGAQLESKHIKGRTPLSWAAGNGRRATVKLLLENGAQLESKDNSYGQTPLSWAAGNGHEAVTKLLLDNGAQLESKDNNYGQTPLSWAAENGHLEVVKLLLERGVQLESRDNYYGRTPLSWAAENGHEAIVKLLLEKGATNF